MALLSCAPINRIVPLRGEDPDALRQSGEGIDWLAETGATRAVRAFREALMDEDYETCANMLGPATIAIIRSGTEDIGDEIETLFSGDDPVDGLSLRGADDPLGAFKTPGDARVTEEGPFDPSRTKANVLVRIKGLDDRIEVPTVFTTQGWRIELVRSIDTTTP